MKKPLILLVDDDRAVLDALEAEFSPAFREVCRIEAFDDPRAVLDALPRWNAENRSIAAAVVDMKMPGMDGVELIMELRRQAGTELPLSTLLPTAPPPPRKPTPQPPTEATHAAAHMRAALLTGYAELDSALDAKNFAAIDRYLEKPWESAQMLAVVRRMISKHLRDRQADQFLVFREITDANRLRDMLRLRVVVYGADPAQAHLLTNRGSGMLDVDEFDSDSAFFAMYRLDAEGEALVGGLRVFGLGTRASGDALVHALGEDHELKRRAGAARRVPLDVLKFWPDPAPILDLLSRCKATGEQLVEVGRFTMTASRDGRSMGSLMSAFAMIEGVAAVVGVIHQVPNTVVSCREAHKAAYSRLGFELLPGVVPMFLEAFQTREVVLHGRPERVEAGPLGRIRGQAARYQRFGHSCRCRSYPECSGAPYETGDFRSADVLCPLRAGEVLAGPTASEVHA